MVAVLTTDQPDRHDMGDVNLIVNKEEDTGIVYC